MEEWLGAGGPEVEWSMKVLTGLKKKRKEKLALCVSYSQI